MASLYVELNRIGGHMTSGADHMTSVSGSAMIGLNITSKRQLDTIIVLNNSNILILLDLKCLSDSKFRFF